MKTLLKLQAFIISLLLCIPLVYGIVWNGSQLCVQNGSIKTIIAITFPFIKWETYYNNKLTYVSSGFLFRVAPTRAVVILYNRYSNINNQISEKIIVDGLVSKSFGVLNSYVLLKLNSNGVTVKTEYGSSFNATTYSNKKECSID